MRDKYLIRPLPPKFVRLISDTLIAEINRQIALCNDDTTPDELLDEIDYGNDSIILQSMVDELSNENQQVTGSLYLLSQNADGTETTLQLFGKPVPDDEKVLLVFLADDFEKAVNIKNRFLGFE